jgi:hypothetical protein
VSILSVVDDFTGFFVLSSFFFMDANLDKMCINNEFFAIYIKDLA